VKEVKLRSESEMLKEITRLERSNHRMLAALEKIASGKGEDWDFWFIASSALEDVNGFTK
jgi:hypothetical protein